jgi:hypothetical protein
MLTEIQRRILMQGTKHTASLSGPAGFASWWSCGVGTARSYWRIAAGLSLLGLLGYSSGISK